MFRLFWAPLLLAFAALPAVSSTAGPADEPCVKETAPLMTMATSWPAIFRAAAFLPAGCNDGYFGEGISDTVVRKMGSDWSGFLRILAAHPKDDKFFSLVLGSLNATLDRDDIQVVNTLARKSCPATLSKRCAAISKRAKEALADYEPPISPRAP